MRNIEHFIEYSDRYEKEFKVEGNDILVCVNKDELDGESESILEFVLNNLLNVVKDSLVYINEQKPEYEIAFINDFSDPQVFVGEDNFSVYWCSEEGEDKGAAVISADYYWPEKKWQGLTVGD